MIKINKWVLIWTILFLMVGLQISFYYVISKEMQLKIVVPPESPLKCIIKKVDYQIKTIPQSSLNQTTTIPNNELTEENMPMFPSYEATIDENNTITNPNSTLVLVNKERHLPDGFIPAQLIIPNVPFSSDYSEEKRFMQAVAGLSLEKLFKGAKSDGYTLYAVSGYRSYSRQKQLFQNYVKKSGLEAATMYSAKPGTSEHQTGLAMDISSKSNNFNLSESFGNKPEGIWVRENAHKYGFIIRYPKDKVDITKYIYEPWHIRYVGVTEATFIFENNLALEEIIKKTPIN